jgi:hypothetical protein
LNLSSSICVESYSLCGLAFGWGVESAHRKNIFGERNSAQFLMF